MSNLKKDPIEETDEYKSVVVLVEQEVTETLSSQGVTKTRGYVHKFWPLKKKILKEKYNIDWKTPAEMNPEVLFD